MLPKERARVALCGGKPDRVPFVMEYDSDYLTKAIGREPWEFVYADGLERAQMHEAFFQRHPCDVWRCWGGPSKAALRRRKIVREQGRAYLLDLPSGRRLQIDRLGGLLDETGRAVVFADDGTITDQQSAPTSLAYRSFPRVVETEDDITELLGPVPSPTYWIEDGFLSVLEYLQHRYGDTHFLIFPLNTIFADALDLFGGFEEGLIALHTKRALFHRALEVIVEWKKSRLQAGALLGAAGAWLTEYCAGADTISRAAYEEFVFPYEQEVAREAHRLGLQTYLWYLGDVMPLLPAIARLEVDGLFPEQGRKGYTVDVVEMRRQLGERMCLVGFNNEEDLIRGDRQALAREIERQIRGAGANGAFMMGTTIATEEVPIEHMDYYLETVNRLGVY